MLGPSEFGAAERACRPGRETDRETDDKNSDAAHSSVPQHGRDTGLESPVLDDIDFFGGGRMSGTGPTSPFIKDEPDWDFSSSMPSHQHLNLAMQNQQYPQVASGSIDPNDLSAHHQQETLGSFNFNAPPAGNNNSNNNMAGSFINDDELADLDFNNGSHRTSNQQHAVDQMNEFAFDHQHGHGQQANMHHVFSNTPNGEPMQSPFLQSNFSYYQQMASPRQRPISRGGAMADFGLASTRRSLPHAMDRKPSDSRSPMTPKTPALAGLHLGGTPESGSLGSQPMQAMSHRHQKSLSGQWDQSPGSMASYLDSPMASPSGMSSNHAGINEVLLSAKGAASVPSKLEHHAGPAYQSQEAKRRRRRESHNLVERRRRDNINERIQELSHLVPQHRLEDEKVRKFLANNGPLSPSMNPMSVSPPQATSMLANGGRRATGPGAITMGLPPVDDKDKGPNKGDILNGSVSWTRDLMWALHKKMQQEAELKTLVESLGGTFPFTDSDDDARLRSELADAIDKNDVSTFSYSRGHGSGLRVPKHTDHAGQPVSQGQLGNISPQSLSPSGGQGSSSNEGNDVPQFWAGSGAQPALKEEDEFDITMA